MKIKKRPQLALGGAGEVVLQNFGRFRYSAPFSIFETLPEPRLLLLAQIYRNRSAT